MNRARWAVFLVVGIAAAGVACGDGSSDGDAAVDAPNSFDAGPPDADVIDAYVDQDATLDPGDCPESYGPTGVSQSFSLGVEADGFDLDGAADLDGDDMPDNTLGANEGLRGFLNSTLQADVTDGDLRVLTELRDFNGLGVDDPEVTLVLFGGVDSDVPRNTADDFSGEEDFYFDRQWVEWDDCSPKGAMQIAYQGGTLTGDLGSVMFYVSSLGGFLEVERAAIEADLEADVEGARTPPGSPARFGGALTMCSLANGSGTIGLSTLHDVVQYFAVQPDIDLDGDGLETVQTDTAGIISCTDGDGETVIYGSMCGCDERMADGFSILFLLDMRGAVLLGPAPE